VVGLDAAARVQRPCSSVSQRIAARSGLGDILQLTFRDDAYPDKRKRMRWATYNRIMDEIVAADRLADARLVMLAARFRL
jgi:hypothetical protein